MPKTLGLTLAERSKPGKDDFDLRPRQVDQWLEELPRGNIGETARQVFMALVDMNRLDYPHQNRIHFLEASRETVLYVTESMQRHFIGNSAPLPSKNWKIAEATREIFIAQANSYLIAIEDLLAHTFLFADTHTLTILIHRAISAVGRAMLICYQTYTPLPGGLWHILHTLYRAAEERKIHTQTVNDEHHRFVAKTTITIEYSRLVLLSLASPYRLRHGEVSKIYDFLERWNSKCKFNTLTDFESSDDSVMRFVVNLASDQPPYAIALLTDATAENCRELSTKPLASVIRKEFKNGFKAGETTLTGIEMNRPDISNDLMKRLLIAWCVLPKRGFPRSEADEQVEVTLGLSATHQVIISGTRRNKATQEAFMQSAQFEAGKIAEGINAAPPPQPDVWDLIYFSGNAEGIEVLEEEFQKEQGGTPAGSADVRKLTQYHPETWAIINESARGYCLQSLGRPKEGRAQVGELVGLRRSIGGRTWKWGIGVIRWLKASHNDRLMLGIEMLTPDAAAIGLRGVAQTNHDYQRTLMLPEIKAINQPTTLITGPVPYRTGNQLVVNILGKEIMIKLSKQVLNTGLFAQFQFEILEQSQVNKSAEQSPPEVDDEFDGVWSSI